MVLNIRNARADRLARELAELDGSPITEAVIVALEEAIARRRARETALDAATRLRTRYRIDLADRARKPVDPAVYRAFDRAP
jgi:antitoxin VapB